MREARLSPVSQGVNLSLADLRGATIESEFEFFASPQFPILLSEPTQDALSKHPEWLVHRNSPRYRNYLQALIAFYLDELTPDAPRVAESIAIRVAGSLSDADKTEDRPDVAEMLCKFVEAAEAGRIKLGRPFLDRAQGALKEAHESCGSPRKL